MAGWRKAVNVSLNAMAGQASPSLSSRFPLRSLHVLLAVASLSPFYSPTHAREFF
jgi:hypothetical protein